jgi:hypothetical protein
MKGPILNLRSGAPSSPYLRRHYMRDSPNDALVTKMWVVRKDSSASRGDHLLWLVESLLDDHRCFLLGVSNVLDELEWETRSKPDQSKRIQAGLPGNYQIWRQSQSSKGRWIYMYQKFSLRMSKRPR